MDSRHPQPATVTVAQTLLVLSAVGAVVGLLVGAGTVTAVISFVTRLQQVAGGVAGPAAGSALTGSSAVTGALALAFVKAALVVVASVWAFVAVGAGRGVARPVLAGVAVVDAGLGAATLALLGAPPALVVGAVLVGALVLDVPVLVLLWVPAASRAWFTVPPVAPPPPLMEAVPVRPARLGRAATTAPAAPAPPAAREEPAVSAPPAPSTRAQNWAPPLPSPRAATSGPLPRIPGPDGDDASTETILRPATRPQRAGRHSQREPQT